MDIWIAAGDETGNWDIVDGSFGTDFTGLAWVLGPLSIWEKALQMQVGLCSAIEIFSQPFSSRLPEGVKLPVNSTKYHLSDIWSYCNRRGESSAIILDNHQEDPVLELLRRDTEWLLQKSGLGVLTVGGSASDAKASGLGISGDGLRERARAYAGLMTIAVPFLPSEATLTILAEGRTEAIIAEAAKYNLFSDYASDTRVFEPYRNFISHLVEDLSNAAMRCKSVVHDGAVINNFICKRKNSMQTFLESLRGFPFLKANAASAVAAMNGMADLAAALVPKQNSQGSLLIIPADYSDNLWTGNYRELSHAFRA